MKYYILVLFAFLFNISFGQGKVDTGVELPLNKETNKYEFVNVDTIKGKTVSELYELTKKFLIDRFHNKEFFVDEKDVKIGNNGHFPIAVKLPYLKIKIPWTSVFSLSIQFKNDRYRIILTNIRLNTNENATTSEVNLETYFVNNVSMGMGSKKTGKKINVATAEEIQKQVNLLFSALSKYLKDEEKNVASDENDNW